MPPMAIHNNSPPLGLQLGATQPARLVVESTKIKSNFGKSNFYKTTRPWSHDHTAAASRQHLNGSACCQIRRAQSDADATNP